MGRLSWFSSDTLRLLAGESSLLRWRGEYRMAVFRDRKG